MNDVQGRRLHVEGSLPQGLSGQYVRIGTEATVASPTGPRPATVVEVVAVGASQNVSYRSHQVSNGEPAHNSGARPHPSPDAASGGGGATAVIDFGGRLLVFGDGTVARAFSTDLQSLRPVDLAGRGQPVGGYPTLDPSSGELHLLASPEDWSCAHQVISPGAMTRHSRPLADSPSPIHRLAVTTDRLVLFAHGATGITGRNRTETERIQWFPTRTFGGRDVLAVHDDEGSVVILVGGRSVERWTLQPARGAAEREVIDPSPHRFGCINKEFTTKPVRYLFTASPERAASRGGAQLHKHDLRTGRSTSCDLGSQQRTSDFTFVRDPQRRAHEDGGWLVGVFHDETSGGAMVVVIDAADLEAAPVATIGLPGAIRNAGCVLWSPS